MEHFARYTRCVYGWLPHTLQCTQFSPVVDLKFERKLNLEGVYQLLLTVRTTAWDGDSCAAIGTITPDVEHSVHIV